MIRPEFEYGGIIGPRDPRTARGPKRILNPPYDDLTCSYFRIRPRGRLNISKLSGFDILIDNFEDRTQIEQKFDFLKGGIHMTK